MSKNHQEPLIHISKRGVVPWYVAWAIRGAVIVAALLVCALITTLTTGEDPVKIYVTIFNGSFGSPRKMWVTAQNVAMLLSISLAVTPAFRMRFWNIGAEGQTLMGCFGAAACMAIIKQLSRQEIHSTAGNCQADDRQESCSSAGNCQADEQTLITQLSRPGSRD